MSIPVNLMNMTGDQVAFEMMEPYNIDDLYDFCWEQWGTPGILQIFVVNDDVVVSCQEDLLPHCSTGTPLYLRMLVSLRNALRDLKNHPVNDVKFNEKRKRALKSFAFPQARGNEEALEATKRCLNSLEDPQVLSVAFEAFAALHGDISELFPYCQAHDSGIRQSAVDALGRLVKTQDIKAIDVLAQALTDTNPSVRYAAIKAFGTVAAQGDWYAINAKAKIKEFLDFDDTMVKVAAVSALRSTIQFSSMGSLDTGTIQQLQKLQKEDHNVRLYADGPLRYILERCALAGGA